VAYLTGSGPDGKGFSIEIFDEELAEVVAASIKTGVLW
jgi:hypothetical protein